MPRGRSTTTGPPPTTGGPCSRPSRAWRASARSSRRASGSPARLLAASRTEAPVAEVCPVVNGIPVCVAPHAGATLLDVLREGLGLTGTKVGCLEGECGACAVRVDGRVVNACLVPAARLDGVEVETIEGLAPDGGLDVLQEAVVQAGAAQCGICIPGMIMSAAALLEADPAPSRVPIRARLARNHFRVTGPPRTLD